MKPKLKWIASNGIEPDLPDGTGVSIVYQYGDEDEIRSDMRGIRVDEIYWGNVICYAIEPPKPLDPVQELVAAAKRVMNHNPYDHELERLDEAIKAVEEMQDE